jgi:stage II sporulation protein D
MLRRFSILAVCIPLLATGAAFASHSDEQTVSATTFVLRGRGWGHGVGMGQWGAYGQAKRGVAYDKILAHYYPGTTLKKTATPSVRILLRQGTGPYAVTSTVPFRLEDGDGAIHDLEPGSYAVGPGLKVALDPTVAAVELPGPLTFLPGPAPLTLGDRPYRGDLQLQLVGKRLQVVNVLGIDAYVRGVVSEEVPDDWPLEVVKAQAVAARSYALAQRREGSILYADTRSQVYGGVGAESVVGNKAVTATKREVLTFAGQVATTFFYSSSGGRTADVADVFAGGKSIPYLVSVPDPDDKVSPYHFWGPVVLPAARVSKLLGVPAATAMRKVPASGRARELVITGKAGEQRVPAGTVRTALGLRSTWITVGMLSLSRPAGTVAPGAKVLMSGTARQVKGPVQLEQRASGGSWEPGPEIAIDQDGAFSIEVAPQTTTLFRLTAADKVVSVPLRIPVATARRLAVVRSGRPAAAGGTATSTFFPDDPLAPRQWHLAQIRAFDFWPELPVLDPVTVAVIDTGVDLGHPDLASRVLAAKSFVGGSADDPIGHGTFVAGLIAAAVDNAEGVAGVAFPAQLLVARVATKDGGIDAVVEAKAIRWAVDRGARVINLSIGGLRDPVNRSRDTFSQEEADAVAYARSKGAVVVAAVGNGDAAPSAPWPFASYPAALPHVIGVSAVTQSGAVPGFSNRDAVFNDLAAPGQALLSTLSRKLTADRPSCLEQGYSSCGPSEFRDGAGTSFSTALVSATAALLFAVRPALTSDQVSALIEHSVVDAKPSTGCVACSPGRDTRSGWGTLDVTAALESLSNQLPLADRYESNDDAGASAATLYGRERTAKATLDFWDDQVDVYRVKVAAGERLKVFLRGPAGTQTNLVLWRPGTDHVEGLSADIQEQRVTQSTRTGPNESLSYHVSAGGWYYVEVKMSSPGSGRYSLRVAKTR